MILSAYLLVALAQFGDAKPDDITVNHTNVALDLAWADAEDRLQGSVRPLTLLSGRPVEVSLHVGTFQGAEFDGPLNVTLKQQNAQMGQTVTVKRGAGEKAWLATLTPPEAGPYTLEVSFRTTRLKVARAQLTVEESPLARWPWYVICGVLAAVAIGLGVSSVLRKKDGNG